MPLAETCYLPRTPARRSIESTPRGCITRIHAIGRISAETRPGLQGPRAGDDEDGGGAGSAVRGRRPGRSGCQRLGGAGAQARLRSPASALRRRGQLGPRDGLIGWSADARMANIGKVGLATKIHAALLHRAGDGAAAIACGAPLSPGQAVPTARMHRPRRAPAGSPEGRSGGSLEAGDRVIADRRAHDRDAILDLVAPRLAGLSAIPCDRQSKPEGARGTGLWDHVLATQPVGERKISLRQALNLDGACLRCRIKAFRRVATTR